VKFSQKKKKKKTYREALASGFFVIFPIFRKGKQ
jgi:hypothetical protein